MKRMMKRFSLFAWLIVTGLPLQPAQAHTSIVKVVPEYKTTMDAMVDEISIEFTDDLMNLGAKKVNSLGLTGPDGQEISLQEISTFKNILSASVPNGRYGYGTYLVSYRVVSADGHSVSGSYELYLKRPSTSITLSEPSHNDEHNSFFHLHQDHIIWSGAIAICLLLWIAYRRFNKESDE